MGDEVLRLWRSTGATVLLITHALDEAAMLADRVGAMSARPGCFIEIIRHRLAAPSATARLVAEPGVRRDHRPAVGSLARRSRSTKRSAMRA